MLSQLGIKKYLSYFDEMNENLTKSTSYKFQIEDSNLRLKVENLFKKSSGK